MFYEEKLVDGTIYYRRTPDGEWKVKKDGMRSTIVEDLYLMYPHERIGILKWFCATCGYEKTKCDCRKGDGP